MKFKEIKITDIIPAEYNPRRISSEDFEKLQNSIEEFGLVDPIIINLKNKRIIGGHQRYDVLLDQYINNEKFEKLKMLKLGDIGWVFPEDDLDIDSEETEKMLNIALNKINGEWDEPKLQTLLEEISFDFDVTSIGFQEVENINLNNINAEYKTDNGHTGRIEAKENVKFKFEKYTFFVPYEIYIEWELLIDQEAQQQEKTVEDLLLEKLKISEYIPTEETEDGEVYG